MSSDFDPYYKWLGIPPKDQPPHHYRLMGIECFEPDAEVIDAAANRVMSYLQNLSVGEQAEASQRLLNEIAAARLCLLNSKRKSEYDKSLREKASVLGKTPPLLRPNASARPQPHPAASPMAATSTISPTPHISSQSGTRQPMISASATSHVHAPRTEARRVRKQRNNRVALAALSIVFAALLGTVYYVLTGDDNSHASKAGGERESKDSAAKGMREKKLPKDKKSPKSGTSLPPLSAFDPNKKPVDSVEEPISNLPPQSQAVFGKWLADADKAIREGRIAQAQEILDRYLRYGDAPQREQAESWRAQCHFAEIPLAEAERLLGDMNADHLQMLESGTLKISFAEFSFTQPTLEKAFHDRLRELYAKIKQEK